GFFEASISTIAAPVRDRTSRVVAALGATIPAARIDPAQLEPMVEKVRASAAELSRLLDYRPMPEGRVANE
ncbi:MAG: IclR family transcriptional regulator, partial [Dyella sp.]|nr:IclR family transcriptional regulator [Dyella sp.]